MLRSSFRLFTIMGIEVGVHVSWLIIFGLVTWSLAVGYFPTLLTDLSDQAALALGAIAAVLLFASVLLHELAHSFVARWRGLDARSITLFLFGGVSNLGGDAKRPSTEFIVAIVGPLSSLAIAAVAFAAASLLGPDNPAGATAGYLALVNLLLAGFNLLPGFPLDGGRVLRAIVWNATDSRRRGTEIAAMVGPVRRVRPRSSGACSASWTASCSPGCGSARSAGSSAVRRPPASSRSSSTSASPGCGCATSCARTRRWSRPG